MRELIAMEYLTLDGLMEEPGGLSARRRLFPSGRGRGKVRAIQRPAHRQLPRYALRPG